MKTIKIKTIDVTAYDWFDKVNGNSYFAGTVCINFGMKNQVNLTMPFQYGYGSHYETKAMNTLIKEGFIKDAESYNSGGAESLWRYCERKAIIYRHAKHENCRQRDLKAIK
jgi:hypothetical protein